MTRKLIVFYDGACPLCRREIGLIRRLDKRERIEFKDISTPDAAEFCPLPRDVMLARFHAQRVDGKMLDGAEAFTEAYSQIPWLIWLRPLGRFAPTRILLDGIYRLFLVVRPGIQRALRKREA